jgi:hypothetical protein
MTFKVFRDKAQWVALFSGSIIFAGQWFLHVRYVKFENSTYVDHTPPVLNLLGLVLTLSTLLLGLITLPRWQSFLALLAFLWVTFIFVQGF